VRAAAPYVALTRADFDAVFDFVATGGYALKAYERFARIRQGKDGRWRITHRGISRRCFVADGERLVMPAFGAYAGGLNIRDRAIVALVGALSFTAHLLGDERLYAIPAARCLSD
jgi:Helicase Lhr winged helix domain